MGTIKCGFWTSRFIITPNEFSDWVELCQSEGFSFGRRNETVDIMSEYRAFYQKRMDTTLYHKRIPGATAEIRKNGFQTCYFITTGQSWRFYNKDGSAPLDSAFIQMTSPKQYPLTSDDGSYFTYEDILQREPLAKSYWDMLSKPITSITKPLYQFDKPMYSVRISKQAYADLLNSAFYENMSEKLTSKWT